MRKQKENKLWPSLQCWYDVSRPAGRGVAKFAGYPALLASTRRGAATWANDANFFADTLSRDSLAHNSLRLENSHKAEFLCHEIGNFLRLFSTNANEKISVTETAYIKNSSTKRMLRSCFQKDLKYIFENFWIFVFCFFVWQTLGTAKMGF